jgi:ABC-2 type transport system ATP-binding protein
MAVIEIRDLKKDFGKTRALDGLTLSVNQGSVYGFIGPNGAGKSTTIRILLGIFRKTSGEARVFGKDPFADAVDIHRRLAYVPGDVSLWPNLTGGETIDLLGRLHGGIDYARRNKLLDGFQLDPSKKSRTYSKGNRQKVALVAAFACESELLLLDEPTSGLDPLMEQVFQSCVRDAKNAGKTVFLSSHILSEVETLCDEVGIIRQGVIVDSGALADMRHLTRTGMAVETAEPADGLPEIPGVHGAALKDGKWRFSIDSNAMSGVMQYLTPLGIKTLTAEPPTLEEMFMRHYEADVKGAAIQ